MHFSVIIPTYNRSAMLRHALDSVARQSFRNFEAIVVDDGSQDDTEEVVRSCGWPVGFHRQQNLGPGAARNAGIEMAKGKYIVFLDSDDQWLPWTLETFLAVLKDDRRVNMMSGVSADLQPGDGQQQVRPALDTRWFPNLLAACTDRMPPVGGTPSICVSREAVVSVGGFASARINGEDVDLWLRLGASEGFVRILNPPVFLQRHHPGSVSKQIQREIAGAWYLIRQERGQAFPGGKSCRQKRRRIVCGSARTVSLDCLKAGLPREAWRLYWRSLAWNFSLGNLKYLGGFPLLALRCSSAARK